MMISGFDSSIRSQKADFLDLMLWKFIERMRKDDFICYRCFLAGDEVFFGDPIELSRDEKLLVCLGEELSACCGISDRMLYHEFSVAIDVAKLVLDVVSNSVVEKFGRPQLLQIQL